MFNVFALSEYDREIAIAEKVYDIAMSEVHYMEAMIDSKLKINLAKSELKVMQESSEENYVGDLAYLFNEAAKESEEQNKSFFSKAKQAVVNFFVSLWNAIQKLFTGKNTAKYNEIKGIKETVTVDGDLDKINACCDAVASALESGVATKDDDKKFEKAGKIIGIGAATAAGSLLIAAIAKKLTELKDNGTTTAPADEIASKQEEISKNVGRMSNALQKIQENEQTREFFAPLRTIGTVMSAVIGKADNALTKVLEKFGKGEKNETSQLPGTVKVGNAKNNSDIVDYSKIKNSVKREIVNALRGLGLHDKEKGNAIKLADIEEAIKIVKGKIAQGKCKNLVNKVPVWEELADWMKSKNINEFAYDFEDGDMFTESEYAEYAELFE